MTNGERPPVSGRPSSRVLAAAAGWGAAAVLWAATFTAGLVYVFSRDLPDTSGLYQVHRQPSITYLDRSGAVIGVRGSQYAPPVDLDRLPAYVPAAFVAIEDRRFYQHLGFDAWGIMRAVAADLRHGHTVEGASTITQQLARNLFLTPDQTIKRKVQEVMLAVWLERKFTKKQILSLYLNRVYFGGGAYGIEAAAQRFFTKPASQLSVGEAAMLAGLLKSPTHYSPVGDAERSARRATIVLDKMVETKAITPEQRADAFAHPVKVSKTLATAYIQYFVDWVDGQTRQMVGQPQEDLVVSTTLDLPLDGVAANAVRAIVGKDGPQGVQQAALVALDGAGRVRALIGGVDYSESQFNRAVDARRQAGSSWKPFVYLAAMEAGRTPDVVVVDEPVTINGWTPRNYTNRFLGPIPISEAVAQSVNTVAARIADEIGRDNVANAARRLGIESSINTDPAMALGTTQVAPLEMAQAYAPFSNGGDRVVAYGVEQIRTAAGRELYEHRTDAKVNVIANPPLSYMTQMLRGVVGHGTGARAAIPGFDIAGKTGTTSDYKDAWFCGFTGGFTTVVWVGKDDNTPMRKVTGGGPPAELWRLFMVQALPHLQVQPIPPGPAAPETAASDPVGDLLANAEAAATGAEADAPRRPAPARPSPERQGPDRQEPHP